MIMMFKCSMCIMQFSQIMYGISYVFTFVTACRKAAFPTFCRCFDITTSILRFSFSMCRRFSSSFNRILFSCEAIMVLPPFSSNITKYFQQFQNWITYPRMLQIFCFANNNTNNIDRCTFVINILCNRPEVSFIVQINFILTLITYR